MTNGIQVVATIGPSSKEKHIIHTMVDVGMSIARLNFSWGTHEEHGNFVTMIREVASEKGINIPVIQDLSGPRVQEGSSHTYNKDASVITEKDINDLLFSKQYEPEYIALSFVRTAQDIKELRALCVERNIASKIIAKIERQEALDELYSIVKEADGIMVARGDLGESIPFQKVPFVQKEIVRICRDAGKPVIVATEMLTSMVNDVKPSRADVSDISQAVLDGATATMLSNETASGKHPIETVGVMRIVVDEALQHAVYPLDVRF